VCSRPGAACPRASAPPVGRETATGRRRPTGGRRAVADRSPIRKRSQSTFFEVERVVRVVAGESGDGRVEEEIAKCHWEAELAGEAADEPGGRQGVPARAEEAGVPVRW